MITYNIYSSIYIMCYLLVVELAYHGHTVRMYDKYSESIDAACGKIENERQSMVQERAINEHFVVSSRQV